MSIIWTILIGFVVGVVAKFFMPGRDPAGFIITVLIGIAGSVIATYLGRFMGFYQVGQSAGFIAAVLGAIVLLIGYRLITGKRG
ncbi:GlsB/YeaQ/YmgE family stress response membrane protein [Polaromonas sp.]|uniref:GlsB/YeaQ/YmgE family stress response membrane protein n=1 Tax=Polaromonas sp. TaxID=1869339 RepID=UPI001817E633|nr:GlsB/YeaQ/YmgE family stress response membrane protein [Polaromonas sp.]NML84543.1 GlsB/YeaQ/YmgE family stress response membrane protein [Polaromonas sp.]